MKRWHRLVITAAVWGTICGVAGWWVANGPADVRALLFLTLSVVAIGFAVALAYMEEERNQWRDKATALKPHNLEPWQVAWLDRALERDADGKFIFKAGSTMVPRTSVGNIPPVVLDETSDWKGNR